MKFLCDVHISIKISKRIEELGFSSEHVNQILDRWHTKDQAIATFVDENDCILITKDQDFRNSFLLKRSPKKLIKINLGNISNGELLRILEDNLKHFERLNSQASPFMVEINEGSILSLTK